MVIWSVWKAALKKDTFVKMREENNLELKDQTMPARPILTGMTDEPHEAQLS